jgi:hypothetical protein
MQSYCVNKLDIKGSEKEVKNFLNDFSSSIINFSMFEIVDCPASVVTFENWAIRNWGTNGDIFNCSSYSEVMSSYEENNGVVKVSIYYYTKDTPNETFVKRASKIYPKLTFIISYYEPNVLCTGKTTYKKGIDEDGADYYEVDEENRDATTIYVYEFAMKENLISLDELSEAVRSSSSIVKNYFKIDKEEDDLVLDFNVIKQEYLDNLSKGDD